MPTFPTLSSPPSYPLSPDGDLEDVVLRSPMEAGYEQRRPRSTRARRTYGISYHSLPDADIATLRTFEKDTLVNGSAAFTWTHPVEGTSHTVALTAPIKYGRSGAPAAGDVNFTIREV